MQIIKIITTNSKQMNKIIPDIISKESQLAILCPQVTTINLLRLRPKTNAITTKTLYHRNLRRLSRSMIYCMIAEKNITTTTTVVNISSEKTGQRSRKRKKIDRFSRKISKQIKIQANKILSFADKSTPLQRVMVLSVREAFNPD